VSRLIALLILFALMTSTAPATAKTVYSCKGNDGSVSLQDQPCAGATIQREQDLTETYRSTSRISEKRSSKAKAEFQRLHPCPRNGATRGRCPAHDLITSNRSVSVDGMSRTVAIDPKLTRGCGHRPYCACQRSSEFLVGQTNWRMVAVLGLSSLMYS